MPDCVPAWHFPLHKLPRSAVPKTVVELSRPLLFADSPIAPSGLIIRDVKLSGDRVYTDTGLVIDPVSGTVVGQFQGTPFGGAVVRPDATSNRTFFLPMSAGCPAPINLLAFDQTTLQPVGSVPIQGLNCPFSLTGMNRLIRWGAHGLAGITSSEVVVLNTSLIP